MDQTKTLKHEGDPERPLVHVVCWCEEGGGTINVNSSVELTGNEESPVHVKASHEVAHRVEPLDHSHQLQTALAEPIHHAFQMRTPLQVRFCNPWHMASDYEVVLTVGKREIWTVRVRGATVATPQPCDEDPCPPVTPAHPGHP